MTLDLIRRLLKTPPADLLQDLSRIELSCGSCLPSVLSELLAISLAPEVPNLYSYTTSRLSISMLGIYRVTFDITTNDTILYRKVSRYVQRQLH